MMMMMSLLPDIYTTSILEKLLITSKSSAFSLVLYCAQGARTVV